jgi:hypothetical protein
MSRIKNVIRRGVAKAVSATLAETVGTRVGQEIVGNLKAWTTHWRNAPEFSFAVTATESGGAVDVCIIIAISGTSEQKSIYNFMDGGTRPHVIAARRSPFLMFRPGYRRALQGTRPHYFSPGPARRSGPAIKAKAVVHPGISARSLTQSAYTLATYAAMRTIRGSLFKALAQPNVVVEVEFK